MELKLLTNSPGRTRKIGKVLAGEALETKPREKALVIGLRGDLGGGKTTFLQGFAKGLRIKQRITSPTFVIIKRFRISGRGFQNFYHIDCYRIRKPKEILELGFKEIMADPKNIVAIEWADRVKSIMPKETIWLNFEFINKGTREIVLQLKNVEKIWKKNASSLLTAIL